MNQISGETESGAERKRLPATLTRVLAGFFVVIGCSLAFDAAPADLSAILEVSSASLADGLTLVSITTSAEIDEHTWRYETLSNPQRAVIRFRGFRTYPQSGVIAVEDGVVRGIRFGFHPEFDPPEVHVVLDLDNDAVRVADLRGAGTNLLIHIVGPGSHEAEHAEETIPISPTPAPLAPTPSPIPTRVSPVPTPTPVPTLAPPMPTPTPIPTPMPSPSPTPYTHDPDSYPSCADPDPSPDFLPLPRRHLLRPQLSSLHLRLLLRRRQPSLPRSRRRPHRHSPHRRLPLPLRQPACRRCNLCADSRVPLPRIEEIVVTPRGDGTTSIRITTDRPLAENSYGCYRMAEPPPRQVLSLIGVQETDLVGPTPGSQSELLEIDIRSTPIHRGARIDMMLHFATESVEVIRIAQQGNHLVLVLGPIQ